MSPIPRTTTPSLFITLHRSRNTGSKRISQVFPPSPSSFSFLCFFFSLPWKNARISHPPNFFQPLKIVGKFLTFKHFRWDSELKILRKVHLRIVLTSFSLSLSTTFRRRLLGITSGIEIIGGIQWELLGCLVIGWLLVYFIIRRGLHQSGKIIWFSALFPYVVLFILLGRAVTLEGSYNGLLYYVTPRWEELMSPGPWIDGATQIFFAYSIGTGALPALGSYNKFHHNCYKWDQLPSIVLSVTFAISMRPIFLSNCNLRCAILFDQQSLNFTFFSLYLLLENIRDFILTIMRKGNAF